MTAKRRAKSPAEKRAEKVDRAWHDTIRKVLRLAGFEPADGYTTTKEGLFVLVVPHGARHPGYKP